MGLRLGAMAYEKEETPASQGFSSAQRRTSGSPEGVGGS